jgi:predicted metal-binding membrane protein
MMSAMMAFHNPTALSLFTVIWTAGMAVMMFPAITPMVLLYDRLIKNNSDNNKAWSAGKGEAKASLIVGTDDTQEQQKMKSLVHFWSPYSLKMVLFIGSYLLIWALTGIAILIGWSIPLWLILSLEHY